MKKGILSIFRKINRKIIILFVLSVLVFISFIGLLYHQKEQQEKTRAWVDQSNQIVHKLNRIHGLVSEAESASRVFIITGDSSWIKELGPIYQKLQQDVSELVLNSQDGFAGKNDLVQLQSFIQNKIDFQKSFSQINTVDKRPILEKLKRNGEAKQITRDIVSLVQTLLQNENALLTKRIKNNQDIYVVFVNITIGTLLILFIFLLLLLAELNKDISLRKRTEEKIIQSETKYKNLIENAGLDIYLIDVHGNISFANQQTTNLTGYSVQDLTQKNYSIFIDPEYTARVLKFYEEQIVSKTKKSYYQFPIRTSSGEQKWIEQLGILVYDEDTVFGIQCIAKDITEAKLIQEELKISELKRKENEIRLKSILDNSTSLIFIKDQKGKYVMANQRFKDFFGLTEEKVIGNTDFDFLKSENAIHNKQIEERICTSLVPIESEEIFESIGGAKTMAIARFPLLDVEGFLLGIGVVATDITEKLASQMQHMIAIKTVETTHHIQEQFLANMSHEIRTPLNGIQGMTRLLLETNLNEDQKSFTNMIIRSLNNLAIIINNILDYSNLKTGKLVFDRVSFTLATLLEEINNEFAHQFSNKSLEFTIHINENVPEVIVGDTYRLKQILSNLMSNAIKFTNDGKIHLEVNAIIQVDLTAQIEFVLSDTGIGIPDLQIDAIFKSFVQADNASINPQSGLGLGLTISKGLVELQGGTLTVKKSSTKGSVFSFTIPFGIQQMHDKSASFEEYAVRLQNKKVLIVEDNLVNQRVINFVLQKVGVNMTIAGNGKEAITILEKQQNFDLIIMDLQMPVMDGYEAANIIRQQLKLQIPIIAMTATASEDDKKRCFLVGMNDFILKPFNFTDLYKRVLRAIYNEGAKLPDNEEVPHEKLFDLSILEELGDDSSLLDIINIFFENIPKEIDDLKNYLKENNPDKLSKLAHKIKGAVSILQSTELAALLKNMELQSIGKTDITFLEKEMDKISNLFSTLKDQLQKERDRIMKQIDSGN